MDRLARWEPIGEMRRLREQMSRLLDEVRAGRSWIPGSLGESEWRPKADVYETGAEVVVRVDVPGMKKEDLEITASEDSITIRGQREFEEEVKEGGYHRRERHYGRFVRSIPTPSPVDAEKAKAKFSEGVLEIRAPKLAPPEAKGQKVAIE